ncbi:TetR family transcriptional regulator [Nocardioides sp. AN3]
MRQAIRSELADAALRSFLDVGFEATTVSAIAASVGVSERTFFRYFPAKEDAVLEPIEAFGASIAETLRGRPASESALDALRAAFDSVADAITSKPDTMAVVMRLNQADPALRIRHLRQQEQWISVLMVAEEHRVGPTAFDASVTRLRCAAMMIALEKALVSCLAHDDFTRVGAELDMALEQLRSFLAH